MEKACICIACQRYVVKCKKAKEQYAQLSTIILANIQRLVEPQVPTQPIDNRRKRSHQEAFSTAAASPEVALSFVPSSTTAESLVQPVVQEITPVQSLGVPQPSASNITEPAVRQSQCVTVSPKIYVSQLIGFQCHCIYLLILSR